MKESLNIKIGSEYKAALRLLADDENRSLANMVEQLIALAVGTKALRGEWPADLWKQNAKGE
jgi:hypothetical protein